MTGEKRDGRPSVSETTNRGSRQELAEFVPVQRPSDAAERAALLARIDAIEPGDEVERFDAVTELAQHCSHTGRQREALPHLAALTREASDPEVIARAHLVGGQLLEQVADFRAAADLYTRGASAGPTSRFTSYFLSNNLGFCLNEFGLHRKAVAHCCAAIGADPRRHNAYKNLGLALEGLGLLPEAIQAYLAAAARAPGDCRALNRIEAIVEERPGLLTREQAESLEHYQAEYRQVLDLLS